LWEKRLRDNSNSNNYLPDGNKHGFSELSSPNFQFGSSKGINSFYYPVEDLQRILIFTDGIAPFE
jgi:hypothetical protein